jgi:hypothetical protein
MGEMLRPTDDIAWQAGAGLTTVAFDFEPAIAAVEHFAIVGEGWAGQCFAAIAQGSCHRHLAAHLGTFKSSLSQ